MTPRAIHRLAAIGMMVSGLLLGFSYVAHPHKMPADVIASTSWFFVHGAFLVSLVVGLLGTVGLYARAYTRTGLLGFAGFLLLFCGMMLIAGLDYYEVFIAPHLAVEFPAVIERYGAGDAMGPVAIVFPVSGSLTVLGYALLAVANLRAGSFPRWPMVALAVTAIVFGVGLSPLGGIMVAQAGAAAFGIALVWVGWAYLRHPAADAG